MTGSSPLTIEQVPLDDLRPDPANPRHISEEELEALNRSITEFGFVQSIVARKEDGVVIIGGAGSCGLGSGGARTTPRPSGAWPRRPRVTATTHR